MKPRSLVFDLFGDYLRYRGGEVRLPALIALMGDFDVAEPTARVAVARMRREGWLSATRDGRESTYRLTDDAWRLLDEGRDRIFRRDTGPWDGLWHMVIYSLPESERRLRGQLRKKLSWLGFGALFSSVWVSAHDRTASVRSEFARTPAVRIDVFHSRSEGNGADREIASRAWDLAALDAGYATFVLRYRRQLPRYQAGRLHGLDALRARTALVHDYRKFPFRDPDLPADLLPARWSGGTAHELFLEAHAALRAEAEAHVDGVLAAC